MNILSQYRIVAMVLLATSMTGCAQPGSQQGQEAKTETVNADSAVTRKPAIRIMMVGDIMMGTTFPDSTGGSHLPAERGRHLFDNVKGLLCRADVACGNLEGVLLDSAGERREMRNPDTYYVFRMPTYNVENLTDAGIDFMGLANNHINDFGPTGRRSTMKTLDEHGVAYAGLKGRCEYAMVERNGMKIAITQFGHGGNNLDITDINKLKEVVAEMRREADMVIVAMHGGAEGRDKTHVPGKMEMFVGERRGNVKEFAHAAIDAGADLVYGHGPHVPRAAELYKGHIIFYSLGNFCTPYRVSIQGVSGLAPIAEVVLDEDGMFLDGKIHSFVQRRGMGPKADSTNAAARMIQRLSAEDFPESPLRISDDGVLSAE